METFFACPALQKIHLPCSFFHLLSGFFLRAVFLLPAVFFCATVTGASFLSYVAFIIELRIVLHIFLKPHSDSSLRPIVSLSSAMGWTFFCVALAFPISHLSVFLVNSCSFFGVRRSNISSPWNIFL